MDIWVIYGDRLVIDETFYVQVIGEVLEMILLYCVELWVKLEKHVKLILIKEIFNDNPDFNHGVIMQIGYDFVLRTTIFIDGSSI